MGIFLKWYIMTFHTCPRVEFRNIGVSDLNIKNNRLDRMSISDKTRKSLEKIGLTSYEIRTFSSLLKTGELTASDLESKIWGTIFKNL